MTPFHIYKKLFILFIIFILNSSFAQDDWQREKGLLKIKEEVTFWDKDSVVLRSSGYYNKMGFSGIGQRVGEWKFYNRQGNLEEVTRYYMGLKHGQSVFFHENGKIKIQAFFFLGLPDSVFKAYYKNGNLAESGEYSGLPKTFLNDSANFMDWKIKLAEFESNKIGEWNYFYKNGTPFQTTNHKINDTTEYIIEYITKNGEKLITNGNGVIETQYQSGKPKVRKSFKEGVPNGEYKEWNANGTIRITGFYLNGLKNGQWKERYFVTDQDFQLYEYKNGKKNGEFIEYLADGTKVINGNYLNGNKEGLWEYYFENGELDMTGDFKNNLQHGHWQFWYPNGQLYYDGDFELGKKQGLWSFNYNDGKKWKEGEYSNDKKQGLWDSWYENGNKAFNGSYKNDLEDGLWQSWYENGKLKDRGSYSMGLMSAIWEGWYPNTIKRYEGSYEGDLKIGSWKYWTDQSILKDEESYKVFPKTSVNSDREILQSFKHGDFKSYDEMQGKLVSEGSYNKGMQNGSWKYFFPGGVIASRELNFKDGKLEGSSKEFSRRGEIKSEINYKNNKKNGNMKVYSNRGKLISHVVYKNGVKIKDVLKKIDYKYSTLK